MSGGNDRIWYLQGVVQVACFSVFTGVAISAGLPFLAGVFAGIALCVCFFMLAVSIYAADL